MTGSQAAKRKFLLHIFYTLRKFFTHTERAVRRGALADGGSVYRADMRMTRSKRGSNDGSNILPLSAFIIANASSRVKPGRYGRSVVSASNTSAIHVMRALRSIASPASLSG